MLNKNNKFILFMFIIQVYKINCSLGCMDNSYHMTRPCDFKKYHYVHCDCPCEDIIDSRGTCRKCLHFGKPFRGELNGLQLLDQIFR